jgi:hypothetical protein
MKSVLRVRGALILAVATSFLSRGLSAPAGLGEPRPWPEYRTIMWIEDNAYKKPEKTPLFFQRMREMGVNTALVQGDGDFGPLLENQQPYYVENIVNRGLCLKWNSNVRDWDKFVTVWAKSGRPASALVRPYCLEDPGWRAEAAGQMERAARKNASHSPLAYDIRDELSTTISANPFDYDFNPVTLAKFRGWLRERYPSLAALNAEWETKFATWEDVKPFTSDQIKNRMSSGDAQPRGNPDWQALEALKFDYAAARREPTRWNFSPWADFRSYMDASLASALGDLRTAARRVDPRTPVGIEGTQMPSAFGGYDLWRLFGVLDWVEAYDIGCAREIFGSFMPGKPLMTTVFENDTRHAQRRLWHLLLEGDRGCIVWWSEDSIEWKSADYTLTAKAKALAPALKEMTSPLARLFLRATPERDPIYIHYSQPSIQADWLLESTVDGSTWLRRFSSFEADNNRMAKTREAWLKLFQDLGYSPRFVSTEQIEKGVLRDAARAVLVLPTSLALGDAEASEIKSFHSRSGNTVYCDGLPGIFDEHGKPRRTGALSGIVSDDSPINAAYAAPAGGTTIGKYGLIADYARLRLGPTDGSTWLDWAARSLPARSEISVRATNGESTRTRIHRYRLGPARLLAFERNISYQMSEDLKQAGGNEALEKPVALEAALPEAAHIYDLRSGKYLGHLNRWRFTLDPWRPSLFAASAAQIPEDDVVAALLKE